MGAIKVAEEQDSDEGEHEYAAEDPLLDELVGEHS
jgi:hypothetical protein